MSTKDDRDNRSNQLNPNNQAYWSSRGDDGDTDDENGDSPWIQQQRRLAVREAGERRMAAARTALAIGRLELDLVGGNGRWLRLQCGEAACHTPEDAAGNWFWNCMDAFKLEWQCEIEYAQLHFSWGNHQFFRRPDLAGLKMSPEAEGGLVELRQAEEASQPRPYPIFSHRGGTVLRCIVTEWPPTIREVRSVPLGRVYAERLEVSAAARFARSLRTRER